MTRGKALPFWNASGEKLVATASSANSRKKSSKKKPSRRTASKVAVRSKPLSTLTDEALRGYFNHLNGQIEVAFVVVADFGNHEGLLVNVEVANIHLNEPASK